MFREILQEMKQIGSSKKELREFAFVMAGALSLFGAHALWRGRSSSQVLAVCAALFILCGLLAPILLKPFQKIWMATACILGWFMSRIILGVLFFGIVTPVALILRFTGKKLLDTKWKEKKDTFWINRVINRPKESYEKQF